MCCGVDAPVGAGAGIAAEILGATLLCSKTCDGQACADGAWRCGQQGCAAAGEKQAKAGQTAATPIRTNARATVTAVRINFYYQLRSSENLQLSDKIKQPRRRNLWVADGSETPAFGSAGLYIGGEAIKSGGVFIFA